MNSVVILVTKLTCMASETIGNMDESWAKESTMTQVTG